ncbi:RNA-guided endonuclease TnpB family protein [Lentzea sp. NBRC 102530]|uniref:RNA-guided endonuclease InsQ/TnpB family protein n=1 Tax=Lentzea sp. NBRC 102530 TaxID=3032201 RepID=UPI0024A51369|nr:RNA-guided endonuclease TnpB family protein [Lentzea sp. NBRC 102530]GLY54654.1 transposase [Lentzea sp. NBRC 102530]
MGRSSTKRAFKYRFYPTDAQAAELARTFGCVRLVYNKALAVRAAAWSGERRNVSYGDTSAMLSSWKKSEDLAFLREVSSVPLQQSLRNLHGAFASFFAKRARYPRFKSKKKSRAAAEYTRSAFRWCDGRLTLAKMSEPLAIVWSRPLPAGVTPSTVTVSRDHAGRWFVSMRVDAFVDHHAPVSSAVGVDAGVTALMTLSTGERIANPRHEAKERVRLAKAQRLLARKQKGSANREKVRRRIARVHARVADRRSDHLHKLTTRLVRENQTIVIEDLHVKGMLRNRWLARAIADASWSQMRRMLEYKSSWYGRQLIVVDRWLPSSKTCSKCGHLADTLSLNVRQWRCPCGAVHDRDVNAAKNILAAGLAVAACGDGVRPNRRELVRHLSEPPYPG